MNCKKCQFKPKDDKGSEGNEKDGEGKVEESEPGDLKRPSSFSRMKSTHDFSEPHPLDVVIRVKPRDTSSSSPSSKCSDTQNKAIILPHSSLDGEGTTTES